MRKTLRVFFWMIKGVLLVIALAALVMWPVSCGRSMGVDARRYSAGPASGEWCRYAAASWDGKAWIGRYSYHAWGEPGLARMRREVNSGGEGWRWERWSNAYTWNEGSWPSRWGPLRWDFTDEENGLYWTEHYRFVAAPLWMIAFAGVWPLASTAFAIRRKIKHKRAAREGLCKSCGYDLRATPDKSGGLLPVCPECGATSSTRNTPSPPT